MPIKMQTDMAIHVHMDTLSKVNLFQVAYSFSNVDMLFNIV